MSLDGIAKGESDMATVHPMVRERRRVRRGYCGGMLLRLVACAAMVATAAGSWARAECVPTLRAAFSSYGSGDGQFEDVRGMATDRNGNLFVGDNNDFFAGLERVQKLDPSGAFVTKWGALGTTAGRFRTIAGIAIDATGNVFVTDETLDRVQKFDNQGMLLASWGIPGTGNGQFDEPVGIAVDSAGDVYVADFGNNRIQKFTNDGAFVSIWSTGKGLLEPGLIAVDSHDDVFVVDELPSAMVKKFDANGTLVAIWSSHGGALADIGSIAIDAADDVYIAEGALRFAPDATGSPIQKFDNDGIFLVSWNAVAFGFGPSWRTQVRDLAIGRDGQIYVGDFDFTPVGETTSVFHMEVFGCGCGTTPKSACTDTGTTSKATLLIKDATPAARNLLKWTWRPGTVNAVDFGDPTTTEDYTFCLYDGTPARPFIEASVPAGGTCGPKPCWKGVGSPPLSKGARYHDTATTPDGVKTLLLKPGAAGRAKIALVGQGTNLHLPAAGLGGLTLPVVAQLRTKDDQCWEANYATARSQQPTLFRAIGNTTTTSTTTSTTTTTLDPNDPAAIDLTLEEGVTTGGSSVPFTITVRNGAGAVMNPPPPVDVTVTPVGTPDGTTPTVAGTNIDVATMTLGLFTVTAQVVGAPVSTATNLTVLASANGPNAPSQNDDLVALSRDMRAIKAAIRDAAAALAASDAGAASAAKARLQAAVDDIEPQLLEMTAAMAPRTGFPPSLADVVAAGHTATSVDGDYANVLQALGSEFDDDITFVQTLASGALSAAQIRDLQNRAEGMRALAVQLGAISPTIYGGIANLGRLQLLAARRVPVLAKLIGTTAIASLDALGVAQASPSLLDRMLAALGPRDARAQALDVGMLTSEVDAMDGIDAMDGALIRDAANMVLVLEVATLVKPYATIPMCAAISGASVSGVSPGVVNSYLESSGTHVGFDDVPENNLVLFIGPEAPQTVLDLVETFFSTIPESFDDIKKFAKALRTEYETLDATGAAYDNADRSPSFYHAGEGSLCTDADDKLVYESGFPDVLGTCSVCLANIDILQHDVPQGTLGLLQVPMVRN